MKIKRNNHTAKIFLLRIVTVLLVIAIHSDYTHSYEEGGSTEEMGFYSYNAGDISRFMRSIGHNELSGYGWYDMTRNSNGSALRIFVEEEKKLIIAKCNGEIEITDTPGEMILLDDDNKVIGWLDTDGNVGRYKDKIFLAGPFWQLGDVDPGSHYYTKTINYLSGFDIYEIALPLKHLGCVDKPATIVQALFVKNDLLYIFTKDDSVKCNEEMDCPITLYIFRKKGDRLEEVNKIEIERVRTFFTSPFFIEDMSPWKNEAVFVEYHDCPRSSKFHRYNLDTREMEEIGYATGIGFYLQCDIIRKIIKEREKDSDGRQ